jgi:chromosome segregation ATPase
MCTGCNSPEVEELRAKTQKLQDELKQMEVQLAAIKAENGQLKSDLESARQKMAEFEQIKQGYEAARSKVKESMGQLGALIGSTESPLPAFEDLKNSDWASNLIPGGGQLPADLKGLENELKGLLGGPGGLPSSESE